MDSRLYQASRSGDVNTLHKLIQEDPLILDKVTVGYMDETPLHISALLGHLQFTKSLLNLNPNLSTELDLRGRTPLHLASDKGHVDIVRELLKVNNGGIVHHDQDRRIPLHLAVMKGRLEVVYELLEAQPESIMERVNRGESVLHLCVKYNRLEVLKLLVEKASDKLVSSADDDGNTILHFAAALKQMETIKFLLSRTGIKKYAKARNANGLTFSDVLDQHSPRDLKEMEIQEFLHEAKIKRATKHKILPPPSPSQDVAHQSKLLANISEFDRWMMQYLSNHSNWLEETHGTLMLVATVIATMTFQSALNPPGGLWPEDATIDKGSFCPPNDKCQAGTSILAYASPYQYQFFSTFNTISFISSLSIVLLLISGFPLKNKFSMWVLTITMCTTVTFMGLTYLVSMNMVTPNFVHDKNYVMYDTMVHVWFGLISAVGLFYAARFLYWLVKKLYKLRYKTSSRSMDEREMLAA